MELVLKGRRSKVVFRNSNLQRRSAVSQRTKAALAVGLGLSGSRVAVARGHCLDCFTVERVSPAKIGGQEPLVHRRRIAEAGRLHARHSSPAVVIVQYTYGTPPQRQR